MKQSPNHQIAKSPNPRRRGITAVLSMMFLLIFGSLAAAMAIVSQGNLKTADSHLKINRSLAAAETGMALMAYRLEQVTQGVVGDPKYPGVKTRSGLITDDGTTASATYTLWTDIAEAMEDALATDTHYDDTALPAVPTVDYSESGVDIFGRSVVKLIIPPVQMIEDGEPVFFEATMMPHPLPLSEQPSALGYDDPFYDRLPYGDANGDAIYQQQKEEAGIDWEVSNAEPLDGRFVRVKVTGYDGQRGNRVYRSISMDFRLDKTIPYAVLSRSRVMIGRNVLIRGNVGSLFTETDKENGHPLQIQSDFVGLNSDLDDIISPPRDEPGRETGGWFHTLLVEDDVNYDNRLNLDHGREIENYPGGEAAARLADKDSDGYLTHFDFFLAEFDQPSFDDRISLGEMTAGIDTTDATTASQLFEIMDSAGENWRQGYADGFVDRDDLYSKIRGQVSVKAESSDWNSGLSDWGFTDGSFDPDFKDYLQGEIKPDYGENALTFGDSKLDAHDFDQKSFDTSNFYTLANGDQVDGSSDAGVQWGSNTENFDPGSSATREAVPFGAAYPYDYYDRPVYENKSFKNTRIRVGANALFRNCRFEGVTFIEVEVDNSDPNFNYVGMQEADGTQKHPDYAATVGGSNTADTKPFGNNIRFEDCTFEGPVVSGSPTGDQPDNYTHVRNKVAFTGKTTFDFDKVIDDDDRALFQRSSLLLPHMSVEMGSFDDAVDSSKALELSGVVVAGLIDMRGHITVNGTLITTFMPVSGEAPVKGDTAPQFNTTLGYFSQEDGDLEASLPSEGLGKITVNYDRTLALPDGILGPIELRPLRDTYFEGGK
jgi:hypothetical protein